MATVDAYVSETLKMWMPSLLLCLCLIVGSLGLGSPNFVQSKDEESKFFEFKQGNLSVKLSNFGARIVSLSFPDKHGTIPFFILVNILIEFSPTCFEFDRLKYIK